MNIIFIFMPYLAHHLDVGQDVSERPHRRHDVIGVGIDAAWLILRVDEGEQEPEHEEQVAAGLGDQPVGR